MEKSFVLWEFAKKQNYIFKSNKLVENVGASLIIKNISENFNKKYKLDDKNFVTRGGGKTIYLFDNDKLASEFIGNYSKDLLEEYPGIELFFVKTNFDDEKDDYKEKIDELYNKLEEKKNKREINGGLIGFGIERKCQSTGMPASEFDKDDYISSEVKLKRDYATKNQEREFNELILKGYTLEKEIGKLIKKDKKNYIAIVHIDGNSMGKKLKGILDNVIKKRNESQKDYNYRCISKMKKISEEINDLYKNAFKKMVQVVVKNEEKLKEFTRMDEKILPIRPLILAGDDVTFITSGVIGIECARIMLESISEKEVIIDGENIGKLTACAGVCIIKSGYPFIRAYNMAEELCQNAKKLLLERKIDENALDYHIAQGEINKTISEIRSEYYTSEDANKNQKGNLTIKPLFLKSNNGWKNYENLCEAIENVKIAINDKNIVRGKIKELRSVLKKGQKATEMFFEFYNIDEGKYLKPLNGTKGDYCFNTDDTENKCIYLDAIETYEYFVKLDDK
ncbi:MAG: Cas10/Cmr2 second palm domain-containing protein [Clostridium sp.]